MREWDVREWEGYGKARPWLSVPWKVRGESGVQLWMILLLLKTQCPPCPDGA